MKTSILLALFALTAQAAPEHFTPWPPNGTLYLDKSQCPAPCYSAMKDGSVVDLEVVEPVNGRLVENSAKLEAKLVRLAAEQAARAAQEKARAERKARIVEHAKTQGAPGNAKLWEILKDVLDDLNDR